MTETSTTPPGAEVEGSQSEQLFQALERFIDDEETSEQTLERVEEQAREGNALGSRAHGQEATEGYLNDVRARIAERVDQDASSRRGIAHRVQVAMEIASEVARGCYVQLSERMFRKKHSRHLKHWHHSN